MANNFDVKGMTVVSPKGIAEWCKPFEPDTKFNASGELSTTLLLDPNKEDAQAFIAKLEDLRDRAFNELQENLGVKGKQWSTADVVSEHYDKDGNPTGLVAIKFKLKDISKRKAEGKQSTVIVKDASLKDISNEKFLIGNGSIIRCGGFAFPYEMASTKKVGVSIQFQKLQIIELEEVAGGGDDFDVEGDELTTTSNTEDDLDF